MASKPNNTSKKRSPEQKVKQSVVDASLDHLQAQSDAARARWINERRRKIDKTITDWQDNYQAIRVALRPLETAPKHLLTNVKTVAGAYLDIGDLQASVAVLTQHEIIKNLVADLDARGQTLLAEMRKMHSIMLQTPAAIAAQRNDERRHPRCSEGCQHEEACDTCPNCLRHCTCERDA